MNGISVLLSPLLPVPVLAGFAVLAVGLALWGWLGQGARGLAWHLVPAAAILLLLLNPRLASEEGQPRDDIALVVLDDSPSMAAGERRAQAQHALAEIEARLKRLPRLEVRIVRHANPPGLDQGTRLFDTLDKALADIPRRRLAGTVLITDGQVADIPARAEGGAPVHALIAGSKVERDRRVAVERAPAFGLVGTTAEIMVRVEDPGIQGTARLSWRKDGGQPVTSNVPLNTPQRLVLPIDHAGANIVEIEVEAAPGELILANNRLALAVSGVRDRLKVLLVSGEPHSGERTWRNLLKSDPSVDLIHFTILRPPEKDDRTPLRELALIAFPVKELFEEKLKGFDMVIFDRYRRRGMLLPAYYQNLATYVKEGGALLMAAGPEYGQMDSPYDSALAQVLPSAPTGRLVEKPFLPVLTPLGRRHPVTAGLPGAETDPPSWGPWARIVGVTPKTDAQILMSGEGNLPLLVLNRVGEGRVAELLTDSSWLWGRGWQGGGPQSELLRRLAHWLMKEPELEEERLLAEAKGDRLEIERHGLKPPDGPVTVTAPDGTSRRVGLAEQGDGRATASVDLDQTGLWRVEDGRHVALAAAGSLKPVELARLRATGDLLAPYVAATGGGVAWIEEGLPDLRKVSGEGRAAGASWFGFRANDEREVLAVRDRALVPAWAMLLAAAGGLILAWWRQGR